jgi:hypothetical protein
MGQGEKVSGEQLSLGSAGDRSGALFPQIPFPERVKGLDIFVLRVFERLVAHGAEGLRRPSSYTRPETREGWSRLGPGLSLFLETWRFGATMQRALAD